MLDLSFDHATPVPPACESQLVTAVCGHSSAFVRANCFLYWWHGQQFVQCAASLVVSPAATHGI